MHRCAGFRKLYTNPRFQSLLDGGNLLCYHRQYFNVYTIELIKAGPSTGARKQNVTMLGDFLNYDINW